MRPRIFDTFKDPTIVDRLANKFTVGDGCWVWTAARDRHGYGQVLFGGKMRRAHRVVWEVLKGSQPELELDHLCRNPPCVNPAHLEPVTHRENMRRSRWGMTTHCPQGHEYSGRNVRYRPNGGRYCGECARVWAAERHRRKLAER